ncbi:MAG TPA: hypothetical protein VIX89_14185 [Bryobacteraceae bacterium]
MNRRLNAFALGALFLLCAAALNAQNVFVLPASISGSPNVGVFSANPFSNVGNINANPAANLVLATADGTKFYIISNSGANSILATDSTFSTARVLASLGVQPNAALITPNGKRLLVGAGTLQIIDTANDAVLVGGGLNVMGNVVDIAVNLESTRAFVLVNTGSGSQVTAVDLATNAVIGTITVPGFGTGVSTGPNDLVYVSTQNLILEVDPRSAAVRQQIQLNGRPGKMYFTPDGKLGVAVNQIPVTGNVLVTLDLNTRMLGVNVPTASLPANVILDKLFIPGNNRILAYSSSAQTLFDITLAPLSVNTFSFTSAGTVGAVGLGTDIATPGHPSTQFLFFASGTTLSRIDLPGNQLSGQASIGNAAGAISVTGAAATGTPANILTIGDNQNVAIGATSLPIVVRLTNALGQPLAGVPVTFTTNAAGATLTPASATTNNDGFAVTSVSGVTTGGIFNVVAAAGGITATFNLSSGVIGGVAGGLTIVTGQGQVLVEQTNTSVSGAPLGVVLKDTQGTPIANADITFTITSGNGTLVGGVSNAPGITDVITDGNGMASINFLSTNIPSFPGFLTTTINATTTGGAAATFYVTTVSARTSGGGLSAPTIQLIKPDLGAVLTGQAGQILKGAVQAQIIAASGQPIPFASLRFVDPADPKATPAVTCAGGFALSDSNGIASCDAVLGGTLGLVQVIPNVGYLQTLRPINFNITMGTPGGIKIVQGDMQSGKPGDRLPLPLIVEVSDAFGNILPQTPATWSVPVAGTATLSNVVSTTNNVGRASAVVTLGNTTGFVKVNVTAGSITQTFTFTATVPVAGLQYVSGNSQSATVNTQFPAALVVKLIDGSGNGVAGVPISFALLTGNAVVANSAPVTDAQGNASTTVTAGGTAGPVTIAATYSGFNVTFSLSTRLTGPGNIKFVNGASFSAINVAAPGSIVTITGTGILTGVQGLFSGFNIVGGLPTTFPIPAGVGTGSITINNVPAPIYYVLNSGGVEQVTVQVPFETQPGTANVTINSVGGGSTTVQLLIQPVAPGVFESLYGNQKVAVATRPDGSVVSPANPARRGEAIKIYVTGLGQVSPAAATGSFGIPGQNVLASIIVGLNDAGAQLISAQYAPGMVGVYVLAVQVPADATTGPARPFGLIVSDSTGKQYTAPGTSIPIQ